MTNPRTHFSRRALLAASTLTLALPAAAALAAEPGLDRGRALRVGGTGAMLAAIRIAADAFARKRPGAAVEVVPSLGSTGGIKALLAGALDVALSGRPLKSEERAAGGVARPLVHSPFGFATREDTAAGEVTLARVTDIYAGRVTAWPDGSPVRLILRPPADSDTEVLRRISPAMAAAVESAYARPGLITAATDQDNVDYLERIPGSVGTATLGQILAERRQLKLLRLDGVAPSATALANGSYRHGKTLYLVLGPEPSPLATEFAAFLTSAEGQAVLAGIGGFLPPETATH